MENIIIQQISDLSYIDTSKINSSSLFKDLEFDYLDIAELVMILEDGLEFEAPESMYKVKSVGQLINKIERLKNN